MDGVATESSNSKRFEKNCKKLYHATTGLIFYAFVVAYSMQTSTVVNYIEENLKHHYGVNECKSEETEIEENDSKEVENPSEECEDEFKKWNVYLLLIYAVPAFVLAPFVGVWSDGIHRTVPLYLVTLGIIVSTVATSLAMQTSASLETITFCMYPTCLTGGIVILTLIIFSYETDRREGFETFERFLELTAIYVSAIASSQVLLTILDQQLSDGLSTSAVFWIPVMFAILACVPLIISRDKFRDMRETNLSFAKICRIILPIEFYHLFRCPLFLFVVLLFICTFMYYFDYVGETLEVVNIVTENEPWQISSFSVQGAVQGVTESLGLFLMLYLFKKIVHKRVVDKRLLPKIPLSYLGVFALILDFLTKLIVSFVPGSDPNVQLWIPLIGVICELAIVVMRFYAVMLVSKNDASKSLSLLAWAQLIAIAPGPVMVNNVSDWSQTFWSNFVYLFMGLLLIIPAVLLLVIGKFGPLPDLVHHPNPMEEEKKEQSETKRRLRRFFKRNKNYNTSDAVITDVMR